MKKTRREVSLDEAQMKHVQELMKRYNLNTESKAIVMAIDLACVTLPEIQFECGSLKTKNKMLFNEVAELSTFLHNNRNIQQALAKLCKKYPLSNLTMF